MLLVLVMCGAAWASVPLYDWFCRVTGYGGTPLVASENTTTILDREITVRFDASLSRDMVWRFRPEEREITVRIGETNLAHYIAHNPTPSPAAASATFNVFPFAAGEYFTKIECFCFQEQSLEPGQTVQMPVLFYIDPAIVDDPEAGQYGTITLSYTFYPIEHTAQIGR
ncbi:MAG: cytochrome c oxidase assembly protein [Rhodobacteraceae bacterium]|nr:cytochrome c oxidase assembly protein [Paracoccaceae bacterium]